MKLFCLLVGVTAFLWTFILLPLLADGHPGDVVWVVLVFWVTLAVILRYPKARTAYFRNRNKRLSLKRSEWLETVDEKPKEKRRWLYLIFAPLLFVCSMSPTNRRRRVAEEPDSTGGELVLRSEIYELSQWEMIFMFILMHGAVAAVVLFFTHKKRVEG